MKTSPLLAAALLMALGACASPAAVTGRADNDMLRFSAKNYIAQTDNAQ